MDKEVLLRQKKRIEKRLGEVEARRRESRDNEDVWPGHGGAGYLEQENEYELLKRILGEIEDKLEKLKQK